MEQDNLPKHIAIIMDGNRRWAKNKNLPVSLGHKEGAKTLEKVVRYANKIGIKYITVYAFSTENWKRTTEEVTALMNLFQSYLDDYSKRADSENIKVKIIGNRQGLSEKMQKSIEKCMERTKDNTGIVFNIALNYGGRDEILGAVKNIAKKIQNNEVKIEDITEQMISDNLYTANQPDRSNSSAKTLVANVIKTIANNNTVSIFIVFFIFISSLFIILYIKIT